MKRATKSRINAIENAGTMLQGFDFGSELSQSEITDHHKLGDLLVENAKAVVEFLIKLQK